MPFVAQESTSHGRPPLSVGALFTWATNCAAAKRNNTAATVLIKDFEGVDRVSESELMKK